MTGSAFLLSIGVALTVQEPGTRLNSRVAQVGDEMITQVDLDRAIMMKLLRQGISSAVLEQLKRNKPGFSFQVLQELIEERLILQEAWRRAGGRKGGEREREKERDPRRRGRAQQREGYISERHVDSEIDRRIRELQGVEVANVHSHTDFYRHIKQTTGLSRGEIREEIRDALVIRKYLEETFYRGQDRFVSPNRSRRYYRTHLDEFTKPVQISFRQIYLESDRLSNPEVIRAIEQELEEGRQQGLEDADIFRELATKHSENFPRTPEERGRIWTYSFQDLQHLDPQIRRRVMSMREGEISPPTRSKQGIFYFYLVERVEGEPKSYEEAQRDIERNINVGRRRRTYTRFIDRLRQKTEIRVFFPGKSDPIGQEGTEDAPAGPRVQSPGETSPGSSALRSIRD
ncbi:MAG: SurA N-terminal domain-containing protein [Planctomycetota bacterium]|nr:SurA N-terminal domain-containing protein [Planctomycetota bacterium]